MTDTTFSRRRLMQGTAALGVGLAGAGLAGLPCESTNVLAQTPVAADSTDAEASSVAVDAHIYF